MPDLISDLRRQADDEFLQQWTATRVRGRVRYILLRGVMLWGGLMGLGMSIGWWLAYGWSDRLLHLIAFLLVSFGGSGYVAGSSLWKSNERRFRELTATDQISSVR